MRLHSISYKEHEDQSYAWTVDELSLIEINLLVGKNATGKSRVLRVINGLARLIEGAIQPTNLSTGHYQAVFKDYPESKEHPSQDLHYTVHIYENKVVREVLIVGKEKRLDRNRDGRGSLYFEKNNQYIDVQIPQTLLASAARRDSQQHVYFEALHKWAGSVRYFQFAKIDTDSLAAFEGKPQLEALKHLPMQNNLHLMIKVGKDKFGRDLAGPVISDMRKIGYSITDFGLTSAKGIATPIPTAGALQAIYVMESGVDKRLMQNELSDGMLRALATLIYIHFIRLQKDYGSILIDDIGEGLDFERSTKLISTIIAIAESGHLQLAMTTNDRFVMNNVPLKYWSVMQRENGQVKVFNERNSKPIFDEFEEYGFNNFDFFAKGFFSTGIETK